MSPNENYLKYTLLRTYHIPELFPYLVYSMDNYYYITPISTHEIKY